jgi:GR25 family glycosyltransferase involved in LPS biosynthesis
MQFPPILVINLKERTDRWNQISKQLDSLGLSYERVEAIRKTPGWMGCTLSFDRCYRIAKQRRYPWVLILEDDCMIQPGGKERFEQLLPILWQRRNEWDVFSGGSIYINKACRILEKPPLFQINAWSSHCILAHMGSYEKLLGLAKEKHKADHFYKLKIRSWTTYPHIAIQRSGYSNIEQKERHMLKKFKTADAILDAVLHARKRCSTKRQITRVVNKTRKKLRY